jgi:hypothetical protein
MQIEILDIGALFKCFSGEMRQKDKRQIVETPTLYFFSSRFRNLQHTALSSSDRLKITMPEASRQTAHTV